MAVSKNPDCVRILKDILTKKDDTKNAGNVPSGAVPTFWMFTLPETPTERYNEVYTNILLGDRSLAIDKELLKQLNVTHVVNAAQGTKFNQIPTGEEFYSDVGIKFYGIPAMDIYNYELSNHFQESAQFIEEALASGGRVFVHCMMGISRSTTIVVAYLMLKKHMLATEALQEVRNKRAVYPNDGFLLQLCALNEELYGPVTPLCKC